jgi:hypothetical protein
MVIDYDIKMTDNNIILGDMSVHTEV